MKKICLLKLLEYCDKYPKILIYGAGEIAKKYIKKIPNINAFIVSDDQKKPDEISGIPVKYLSEISTLNDYGIILCINKKSQMEVINTLEKKGITHYFCT